MLGNTALPPPKDYSMYMLSLPGHWSLARCSDTPEFMYLNSSVIILRTRVTMLTLVDVYIRALPHDLGRVIADIIAVFVWDFRLYFFGQE